MNAHGPVATAGFTNAVVVTTASVVSVVVPVTADDAGDDAGDVAGAASVADGATEVSRADAGAPSDPTDRHPVAASTSADTVTSAHGRRACRMAATYSRATGPACQARSVRRYLFEVAVPRAAVIAIALIVTTVTVSCSTSPSSGDTGGVGSVAPDATAPPTAPTTKPPTTQPATTVPVTTVPTPTITATTVPAPVHVFPFVGRDVSYGTTHHDYPAVDVFGCGAQVVAPTSGAVLEISVEDRWDPAVDDPATRGGHFASLLGDDGVRYYVAHLDSVAVVAGQRVAAGDPLGVMGRTGNARNSACHTHLGISRPCPSPEWQVRRGTIACVCAAYSGAGALHW